MPSKISEKIYIDSNVWFSYITKAKYENTFDKARNIIDGIIENNYFVAVISQLVILEMINICRAKVIQGNIIREN
jgi:predicted nucleic acid-binding protein